MKEYEFFDHTADAEFRAYGKTMEEAFSNAARAMLTLMFNPDEIIPEKEIEITAEGSDEKALLYAFLEEILFLIDSERFIITGFEDLRIDGNKIKAKAKGGTIPPDLKTHGEVKAITYNSMQTGKENNIYFVQVVVDM
jgi:SHS2 domain-containing protein